MKIFSRSILILLVLLLLPRQSFAQDWWEKDMIIVQGSGFGEQARRAAVVDAYRSLAEQIKGVHITAETTIESQIISGDIVQAKVNAVIRGAEILSEEFKDDGSCVVTVGLPVYGKNSVASIAFKPAPKKNFPAPKNFSAAKGNYTGLVIDCGDFNLKPVLAPVVRSADNQAVYSSENLDYDKLVAGGVVGFAVNKSVAKKISLLSYSAQIENKILLLTSTNAGNDLLRAGSNPLVVKAAALSDDNSCPVVSAEDADKILSENLSSHFLDNGSVVFTGYRVGGIRV